MATVVKVGQKLPLSIQYLDSSGQPLTAPPTLDGPPSWANTTPATETLTAAPDGMTAEAAALAAGSDTVRVQLSVGGQQFTATLDVTVQSVAPPQTVASIAIVAGTPV